MSRAEITIGNSAVATARGARRSRFATTGAIALTLSMSAIAISPSPAGQPVSNLTPELISVNDEGQPFTDGATSPAISALGDRVAFSNQALGLPLMFFRDRAAATTVGNLLGAERVSMSADGCVIAGTLDEQHSIWDVCTDQVWSAPQFPNYPTAKPAVSADGGVVVVPSIGKLLILRRSDGYSAIDPDSVSIPPDLYEFLFENATEVATSADANRVATVVEPGGSIVRFGGGPALGATPERGLYFAIGHDGPMSLIATAATLGSPSLDDAGNWLAFHDDEGVKIYDVANAQVTTVVPGARDPSLSRDGRHLAYADPGSNTHTYVLTRLGPTWTAATQTQWMSAGPGVVSNLVSAMPVVSEHGRWVAWATSDIASLGLAGGPTDEALSVVVRERRPVLAVGGHDFGLVEQAVEVDVPVTNAGPSGWRVTLVDTTGPFSVVSHDCPSVVHPGGSCVVRVGFAGAAIGTSTGTVFIRDNSYPGVPLVAMGNLTATVPEPFVAPDVGLALAPNPVDFGTKLVGEPGGSQAVTLQNTGSAGLTVGLASASGANAGDFTVVADQCSGTALASGATCSIEVAFVAGALGPRFALLSVDGSGGTSATTRLVGVGTAPADDGSGPAPGEQPPNQPSPGDQTPDEPVRFFPELSVSPSSTPAGFVVTVSGIGYPPLDRVQISLGGTDPLSVSTDETGAFDLHWMILEGVPEGTYAIDDVATATYDAASADVQVVSSPVRPQGVPQGPRQVRRHVSR